MADVAALLNVPGFGDEYVANHSIAEHLDGFDREGPAPLLGTVLDDDLVAASRLEQQLGFAEIVATGLFYVDVLAGFASHNGCRCVPMIWSGNDDRIDLLVVKDVAQIGRRMGRINSRLFGGNRQAPAVGIAHKVGPFIEPAPPLTTTNESNSQRIIGLAGSEGPRQACRNNTSASLSKKSSARSRGWEGSDIATEGHIAAGNHLVNYTSLRAPCSSAWMIALLSRSPSPRFSACPRSCK